MRRVGVREFRDHATRYLSGSEVLVVERHGRPIGFYIPTEAGREERLAEALDSLERRVQETLSITGLSEEELSRLYDPKEPLPEASGESSETGR